MQLLQSDWMSYRTLSAIRAAVAGGRSDYGNVFAFQLRCFD